MANENMIQKHLDNFLAALCGETPVDTNVRTSMEYWLKRLSDGEGGSTKKVYLHAVSILNSTNEVYVFALSTFVLSTDPTPLTKTTFLDFLTSFGDAAYPVSGLFRQITPNVNNMAISGILKDGINIMAYGIDNQGIVHGKSANAWNFRTQYAADATFLTDIVVPVN